MNYQKRFIKEVSGSLVITKKDKKRVLSDLQREIRVYIEENPLCTYDELVKEFGTPNSISANYIRGLDDTEIGKQLNRNVKMRSIRFAACVSSFVVMLFGVSFYNVFDYKNKADETVQSNETAIKDEEEDFSTVVYSVSYNVTDIVVARSK